MSKLYVPNGDALRALGDMNSNIAVSKNCTDQILPQFVSLGITDPTTDVKYPDLVLELHEALDKAKIAIDELKVAVPLVPTE